MVKIERSVTINAPVDKVFSFMNDPEKLPEYWPGIVEVKNIQPLPNGGSRFDGVYKMVGIRFDITNEDMEFVRNQRVVSKSKGGIDATQTYIFQAEAGKTKLTWTIEYVMPVPVIGKLAEAIVARMNEREADVVIANIKDRLEA